MLNCRINICWSRVYDRTSITLICVICMLSVNNNDYVNTLLMWTEIGGIKVTCLIGNGMLIMQVHSLHVSLQPVVYFKVLLMDQCYIIPYMKM